MKAQTRSHMNDQTNCNSVRASSNQCICISLALFAAFFVQSQNVCGESSPFDWNWVISIPVGLTHVNRYAFKPLSIESEWCYRNRKFEWTLSICLLLHEMTKQTLLKQRPTTIVWPKFTIQQANSSQLFGPIVYSCEQFSIIINRKKYEFLLESSFNSSKLQEINNDIDKIPGIPMVAYLFQRMKIIMRQPLISPPHSCTSIKMNYTNSNAVTAIENNMPCSLSITTLVTHIYRWIFDIHLHFMWNYIQERRSIHIAAWFICRIQ